MKTLKIAQFGILALILLSVILNIIFVGIPLN